MNWEALGELVWHGPYAFLIIYANFKKKENILIVIGSCSLVKCSYSQTSETLSLISQSNCKTPVWVCRS